MFGLGRVSVAQVRPSSVSGPRRNPIYAIIRAGGKQYRVEPRQLLDVDRLQVQVGETIEMTDILLLGGNGDVSIGTPTVEGARVLAEVVEHGRGKKLLVFKYKAKVRYRRRKGHRQGYTRLAIREILAAGQQPAEQPAQEEKIPKRAARPRAKAKVVVAAPETEVAPPAAADAIAAEAKPRRARRAKAEAISETAVTEAVTKPAAEPKPVRRATARRKPAAEASVAAKPPRRPRGKKVADEGAAPDVSGGAKRRRKVSGDGT